MKATAKYNIAFGSNLNMEQMKHRCPNAKVECSTELKGYELQFRGSDNGAHATVVPRKDGSVPIIIWRITPRCEAALDRYEGVPRYYTKEYVLLRIGENYEPALIYVMNKRQKEATPSDGYFDCVKEGYIAAGFDLNILSKALESARSNQV